MDLPRIILTFGMRKSASTYLFQLTRDLFSMYSGLVFPDECYSPNIQHPFIPDLAYFEKVLEETPHGRITVRKVHFDLLAEVRKKIEGNDCFPVIQIRNPLDIIASLLDAGVREREKPADIAREGFTSIHELSDTFGIVGEDMQIAQNWIQFGAPNNFPCLDYDSVTSDPQCFLSDLAARFNLAGDMDSLVAHYEQDPSRIMEYNKGVAGRGLSYAKTLDGTDLGVRIESFKLFLRSQVEHPSCRFGDWIEMA